RGELRDRGAELDEISGSHVEAVVAARLRVRQIPVRAAAVDVETLLGLVEHETLHARFRATAETRADRRAPVRQAFAEHAVRQISRLAQMQRRLAFLAG